MSPAGESNGIPAVFSMLEHAASREEIRQKPFLDRLQALYARMDRRYTEIAQQHGFLCRGCEDSCCRTIFYHHTLVEYLYLRAGVRALTKERQERILQLSQEVLADPGAGRFCPLNEDGRCLVYAHRPMICRLHGIAHELHRPDGAVHSGPGCRVFDAAAHGKPYVSLDRTEFYWDLSNLERDARAAYGFSRKTKMTISQMVEAMLQPKPPKESPSHETD